MKELKQSIKLLFPFVVFISLFSPFFLINGSLSSIVNIFQTNINGYTSFFLTSFFLIFLGFFIDFCHKDFPHKKLISFSLILAGGLTGVFFCNLAKLCLSNRLTVDFSWGAILFFLSCVIYLLYLSSNIFDNASLGVNDIVEIAIFVCFAIVFDFPMFKIKIGATGGSISITMLPLLILCIRKGFIKGFFACGIIFALVSCLLDGYGFAFFPFDYLLGFGSLAIIGLFRKKILANSKKMSVTNVIIGTLLCLLARTFAATISGIVYYNMNFWASFVYQITYIGPSGGIVVVLLLFLLPVIKKLTKY